LKEAGAESLNFQLLNRNVDQPLKYVATWPIDEWSKIGLHVTQRVVPDGPPWFDAMRSGNFDVVLEANGHGLANPPLRSICPPRSTARITGIMRTKRRSIYKRRCCRPPTFRRSAL
jgi:hypothetical protein